MNRNKHYDYKGYRLQTATNGRDWICFVNENDTLETNAPTEAKALAKAKAFVRKVSKQS
jgi:hypothetical protein